MACANEGEKKKRNISRVIEFEESWNERKIHECKENCGIQKLDKRSASNRLSSPLSSMENISSKRTQVCLGKRAKKSDKSNAGSKKSVESTYGSRKSTGMIDGFEGFQGPRRSLDEEISLEVNQEGNKEKRRTRSIGVMGFPRVAGKVEVSVDSSEEFVRNMEGSSSVISPAMMPKGGGEKKKKKKRTIVNTGHVEIEDKRKSNECEKNCGLQGWTKCQEVALQRAFFAEKPSPHFWKKVSKLVPGKSAQECFDKVHSDLVTPPQPPPRSRLKKTNSSPISHFSLSESKLLEATERNVKRRRSNKQAKYLAHKTARHLLQKHYVVDQGYEADLFSVLEPTMNSAIQALPQTKITSTPERGFLEECDKGSSPAYKKPLPRFRDSCETVLVSPPVLKRNKNMALHEKYIDKLHRRESRRASGGKKCITTEGDRKEIHLLKMDVLKAARNALVSDARDLINQFQDLQANAMCSSEDFIDDDDGGGGDDEGEDEL